MKKFGLASALNRCAGLSVGVSVVFAMGLSSPLLAAEPDLPPRTDYVQPYPLDSGWVQNSQPNSGGQVVYSEVVSVPGSPFLRLRFSEATLSGDPAQEDTTLLRIISLQDNETQYFNAESLANWSNGSAVFNGDTVIIELIAHPGLPPSRVVLESVTAGLEQPFQSRTICGPTDDRLPSADHRQARHWPIGCTSWLINDANSMFMTAGHCSTDGADIMQFEVPLSTSSGSAVAPPVDKQYPADGASVQQVNGGVGNDWGYFAVLPNSNTGLVPYQVYGVRYTLAAAAPTPASQTLRITGYGTTSSPISNTWNLIQKTHTGAFLSNSGTSMRYRPDTTGGNSGSAVFDETSQMAIGVHTHAGCNASDSTSGNQGTNISLAALRNALANPRSAAATGSRPVSGPVFASGDIINNVGTVNTTDGGFGKVGYGPGGIQGLAYNRSLGLFYGITADRRLFSIDPTNGFSKFLGTVTGLGTVNTNGLAFDNNSNTLFTSVQSAGRIFRINLGTFAASPVGSGNPGTSLGGIDFDHARNVIFGVDDQAGAGTRLVSINPSTGAWTIVGNLGASATDCNGLAWNPDDGQLYTINAANEQALRINPDTGAATLVGGTGGAFGSGFGMTAVLPEPPACPADFNADGFVDDGDFTRFAGAYEDFTVPPAYPAADLNGDNFVDDADFVLFAAAYEAFTCP